jgi:hypothetical protein
MIQGGDLYRAMLDLRLWMRMRFLGDLAKASPNAMKTKVPLEGTILEVRATAA